MHICVLMAGSGYREPIIPLAQAGLTSWRSANLGGLIIHRTLKIGQLAWVAKDRGAFRIVGLNQPETINETAKGHLCAPGNN